MSSQKSTAVTLQGGERKNPNIPQRIIVHPLVLLSVVDHFNRVGSRRRVLGVLLGSVDDGAIDITNSYAGKTCSCALCDWCSFYMLVCFCRALLAFRFFLVVW
jgi:JAB1/Mov34/MPN/PAD-1 ubiquitin protease